jgi:hypothetical protein
MADVEEPIDLLEVLVGEAPVPAPAAPAPSAAALAAAAVFSPNTGGVCKGGCNAVIIVSICFVSNHMLTSLEG